VTGEDSQALADGLRSGDRSALARALTLVESTRDDDRLLASDLLARLGPPPGDTVRLGVSGPPGVGKSTFIEALGLHLIGRGHRLAVLAVDPSSRLSGGSVLGDKTRMEGLARNRNAFVRPSPTGSALGGIARRTREAILLVEAAGHDIIVVETVGVGQSETEVAQVCDLFLLLLAPAAGDDLQGIKRGIVELADLVIVNKADGAFEAAARRAAADQRSALRMMRPRAGGWQVPVVLCSALHGSGIDEVWAEVERFVDHQRGCEAFAERRRRQSAAWLWAEVEQELLAALRADPGTRARAGEVGARMARGEITPPATAMELVRGFLGRPDREHGATAADSRRSGGQKR